MSTWCVVKIVHIHVTFFVMYVMHFSWIHGAHLFTSGNKATIIFVKIVIIRYNMKNEPKYVSAVVYKGWHSMILVFRLNLN